jgi:galacturan 1,4-alpha-galacturonidase
MTTARVIIAYVAPCKNETAAVAITNLTFHNIQGTYADTYAGQLLCADSVPCEGIVLDNIQLASVQPKEKSGRSSWSCWQANGRADNVTPSFDCFA